MFYKETGFGEARQGKEPLLPVTNLRWGGGAMRNPLWQKSDPGNENIEKRNMLGAENDMRVTGKRSPTTT